MNIKVLYNVFKFFPWTNVAIKRENEKHFVRNIIIKQIFSVWLSTQNLFANDNLTTQRFRDNMSKTSKQINRQIYEQYRLAKSLGNGFLRLNFLKVTTVAISASINYSCAIVYNRTARRCCTCHKVIPPATCLRASFSFYRRLAIL